MFHEFVTFISRRLVLSVPHSAIQLHVLTIALIYQSSVSAVHKKTDRRSEWLEFCAK